MPPAFGSLLIAVRATADYLRVSPERALSMLIDAACDGALKTWGVRKGSPYPVPIGNVEWTRLKYEKRDLFGTFSNIEVEMASFVVWLMPDKLTPPSSKASEPNLPPDIARAFSERTDAPRPERSGPFSAGTRASAERVTEAALREVYAERVATWPTGEPAPGLKDDVSALRALFPHDGIQTSKIITFKLVGKIREDIAPPKWKAPGPRGRAPTRS